MSSISTLDALFLSFLFGASAVLHLGGPAKLRAVYRRWRFPTGAHRVIGMLDLFAALFLSNPTTRIWGVILAAMISFGAVVALLSRGRYAYSVPAMLVLLALIPASLAGPL